ncbi:MgtC/SapB family protein [Bradyrhizobium sp.]|uniref:MgtC/SapB family protein n=1 Tax=Bradyrhizobium sp. TaxID=376 RepID=UPI003C4097F0
MPVFDDVIVSLAVALGIGLLIGAERERRKGSGPLRSPAGIRTFAAASLTGAVSFLAGGAVLFDIIAAGTIVLTGIAYFRSRSSDPGLTTEIVLVLAVLLGGMATQKPGLAAGLAVVVTGLLAARTPLHRFARSALTETELEDALIFGGATLVVLPLLPDQPLGPFGALNPRSIWIIVVLIMAIGSAGHIAVRILGARAGLAITGFASGFVSSIATISSMGSRAVASPKMLSATVGGAVLSNTSTVIQMSALLAATSIPVLIDLSLPMVCAGVVVTAYGAVFTVLAFKQEEAEKLPPGRAFSLPKAVGLAAMLATIMLISASLREAFGESGLIVGAAVAGLADTHAAAVSAASFVAAGKMPPGDAVIPILAALSTNTISKIVAASANGSRAFAVRVVSGLILLIVGAWTGTLVRNLITPWLFS